MFNLYQVFIIIVIFINVESSLFNILIDWLMDLMASQPLRVI